MLQTPRSLRKLRVGYGTLRWACEVDPTPEALLHASSGRGRKQRRSVYEDSMTEHAAVGFQYNGTPLSRECLNDLTQALLKPLTAERIRVCGLASKTIDQVMIGLEASNKGHGILLLKERKKETLIVLKAPDTALAVPRRLSPGFSRRLLYSSIITAKRRSSLEQCRAEVMNPETLAVQFTRINALC